ncbi:nucleotidyltransferase domain-containing protein [Pseudorhodoplanes sp.]|uniref:nucleotidyltransferase domain-containing protein n=1 Tax=Pseudorhodoplanes sp. TaxID=1934341 RepID=UPI003D14F280
MPISEDQLQRWSKPGPTAQFTATYDTLKTVLNDPLSPYYLKDFAIFLQGSYKNDTNVYGDSDVDVVVRLDSIFFTDLDYLSPDEKARYQAQRSPGTYTLAEFRRSVVEWLTKKYGSDVKPGKKAIFIKGNGNRRDADVLVCAKLKRYYTFPAIGNPRVAEGICFFLPDGTRVDNYPELHSDNCTTKHQNTRSWFKHTVRIFKNLRNTMIEKLIIADGLAPSYFIEGMLYNVPEPKFGGTEQQNFRDVLVWLLQADRTKFLCANEQFYLLGNSQVTWPAENCAKFLVAAEKYWNEA